MRKKLLEAKLVKSEFYEKIFFLVLKITDFVGTLW